MPMIDIGGNLYPAYSDVATADIYLLPDVELSAVWTAATNKDSLLVSATRWLDRQTFAVEFDHDTAPQAVVDANALLAALLAQDPTIASSSNTGSNIRSAGAGTARAEFFAPDPGKTFPDRVQEILNQSGVLGSSSVLGSFASGTRSVDCPPDRPYAITSGYGS